MADAEPGIGQVSALDTEPQRGWRDPRCGGYLERLRRVQDDADHQAPARERRSRPGSRSARQPRTRCRRGAARRRKPRAGEDHATPAQGATADARPCLRRAAGRWDSARHAERSAPGREASRGLGVPRPRTWPGTCTTACVMLELTRKARQARISIPGGQTRYGRRRPRERSQSTFRRPDRPSLAASAANRASGDRGEVPIAARTSANACSNARHTFTSRWWRAAGGRSVRSAARGDAGNRRGSCRQQAAARRRPASPPRT